LSLGCSSIMLNSAGANLSTVISARTMDFPFFPYEFWGVVAVKKGVTFNLLPTEGKKFSDTTAKYSFFCMTAAQSKVRKLFPRKMRSNAPGFCTDGMNEAGLTVAIQWDCSNQGYQTTFNPNGPAFALAITDIVGYAMGNFATVEEATAAFTVGNIQLLYTEMINNLVVDILGPNSILQVHVVFQDRTGKTSVLEWDASQHFIMRNNPTGVTTNEPQLPAQYAQFNNLVAAKYNLCSGTTPNLTSIVSDTRFVRLVLDNEYLPGVNIKWSTTDPISPAYDSTDAQIAMITVLSFLDTVWQSGFDDDITLWGIIRDHSNRALYIRTVRNTRWSRWDFSSLDKVQKDVTLIPLSVFTNDPQEIRDVNGIFASGKNCL